jgi:hypothetical protein
MTDQKKSSKFALTEVEQKNIQFRHTVLDYISNAINNETGEYIFREVRPRLGVDPKVVLSLSEDGKWLEEEPEESKIIIPNGVKK